MNPQKGNVAPKIQSPEHVSKGLGVARHLQPHIKPLAHFKLFDGLGDAPLGHIDRPGGAHACGQTQAIIIDVGDHHMACPGMTRNGNGHDADGPGPGDEHILPHHIKRKGRVGGVAQGVQNRGGLITDGCGDQKGVECGNGNVLSKTAGAVYANPFGVATQVALACLAVPAMAAGDVSFGRDPVTDTIALDLASHLNDNPCKLMPDDHGGGHCLLGPRIPVVDMNIRPADGGSFHLDQEVVGPRPGNLGLFHPDSLFGPRLTQHLHFIHAAPHI